MDNEAANRIRQEIEKLVKSYSDLRKFKNDKEIAAISEANVRADYIDRLFGILGWNTSNPDEYDREHFISGAGFADVALILNKKPVIFIEAKRFGGIAHSKDIKGDWTFEERQSILYAVSKNCKWAILTNFEKFRVFNALTGLTTSFILQKTMSNLEGLKNSARARKNKILIWNFWTCLTNGASSLLTISTGIIS
jgi:predicted type IV restriction endonuclease